MSSKSKQVHDLFEKHNHEYLEFDNIGSKERLHESRDICAMLYLHNKFGGKGRSIAGGRHDEIFLDWDVRDIILTDYDVLYLTRCGVRYDSDTDSLAMFV